MFCGNCGTPINEKMENEKKDIDKNEIKSIQKKANKIVLITMAIVMVTILIIAGVTSIVSNINEKKKQEQIAIEESTKVTVPNLVGITYKEAKEEIEKLGLQVDANLGNLEDDNIVTMQVPSAEERIKRGETVTIYLKVPVTAKSDNFYGMRFRKTISEFCKSFNHELENIYTLNEKSTTTIELDTLKESDFEYFQTIQQINLKQYRAIKLGYQIMLFVENDSNYIVNACVGYDTSKIANADKFEIYILTEIYPAMAMTLTEKSYENIKNIYKEISEEKYNCLFKDNINYYFTSPNSYVSYLYCTAMSENKYKEYYTNTENNTPKLGIEKNSEQTLININESNNGNQSITQQNSSSDTSNIKPSAGNKENNSSNNSSSNQSSISNSNPSINSNNATENEYFDVTVNINMKQLIQNNANAKKVVDNVKEYPVIHISISDGAGDTGLVYELESPNNYLNGRQSIPNTITRNISTKVGKKIKFIIEMSSSNVENANNSVETTLLEKEMTFDKAGTYEIK